jgi:FMN phosphatase YigB (HAD superfamily)
LKVACASHLCDNRVNSRVIANHPDRRRETSNLLPRVPDLTGSSILSDVEASIPDVVFLLDVDNTLLDNDAVIRDLRRYLTDSLGIEWERRYWDIFEARRRELGYADYLGALQRYREEYPRDPHVLRVSLFLLQYAFAERLYPRSLEVIDALRQRGPVVILSDGDVVFQPYKVERAGLWAAVGGRVLIYVHKESMLDDVERQYPARHYVMVDDKLRILLAMKESWGRRLTTVFVRQGHYARESSEVAGAGADLTLDAIGELTDQSTAAKLRNAIDRATA